MSSSEWTGFAIDRVKRPSICETAFGFGNPARVVLAPTNKWREQQVQGSNRFHEYIIYQYDNLYSSTNQPFGSDSTETERNRQ